MCVGMFVCFRYTPQAIELDHKLKPFIPDYIPAVGDIDAFIKVSSCLPLFVVMAQICSVLGPFDSYEMTAVFKWLYLLIRLNRWPNG